MGIPARARLALKVVGLLEREPVMQAAPDRVRALAEKRRKLVGLPGSALIVGRRDRAVRTRDVELALSGRALRARVYEPVADTRPAPLVMNFHGGGFVSGDPLQSEWWCAAVAAGTGAVVVSVDYRKAPEHPYPTAPEDCYDATVWAIEHAADLGIDASRVAVMGDSAGGNLAAVVAVMSRDRSGPSITHQVLVYPAVEFVEQFASEAENRDAPVLTKADIDGCKALYFHGLARERMAEPYASPLRADPSGLPPALIQTARFDPLRDQGAAYADRLRDAGVPVRLTDYVATAHGYLSLPGLFPAAHQALAEAVAELRRAFAA